MSSTVRPSKSTSSVRPSRSRGLATHAELLKRLDKIERTVATVKIPGSVADKLYVPREHITWVRERLAKNATGPS